MLVDRLSKALMPVLLLAQIGVANADLRLLKPDPAIPATAIGRVGYSADALGQDGVGGTIQAEVPAGSTVLQAYLYGTYFDNPNPVPPDTDIDFDGTPVTLVEVPGSQPGPCCGLATARADVTAQVAAKVASGGGITDFAVNTDPASLDGVSLVVIYSNPALPMTTIAVLDGGALQAGDVTTFTFGSPLDKTIPGFAAILSLGSGFSLQGIGAEHECGTSLSQSSLVDVNGTRLTSCAGNFDDGLEGDNDALITTGGVGDSTNNPAFPLQQPAMARRLVARTMSCTT